MITYIVRSLLTSDKTKSSACICADALCLMSACHESWEKNAFWCKMKHHVIALLGQWDQVVHANAYYCTALQWHVA